MSIVLDGNSLTLKDVLEIANSKRKVSISAKALERVTEFRSIFMRKVKSGEVIYGVNTGFGSLSNRIISDEKIAELQTNLIRSHSVGVGQPLPSIVVRAAMTIQLNSLLSGNSCVRPDVVQLFAKAINSALTPFVPSYGSLGASGDLAPSAHVVGALMGEGKAYCAGELMGAKDALRLSGLEPLKLEAKEGLSLTNSTAFTTALASIAIWRSEISLDAANKSACLSAEVLRVCGQFIDKRLMSVRNVAGQSEVARSLSEILAGSRRLRQKPTPQDPYSIRCVPQVHGAVKEALDFAKKIIAAELNSVTDNPIMTEEGEMLHGGNFHAQPVAMSLDFMSIASAYLGVLSLSRIHLLLSSSDRERRFFANNPGLESGLMMTEYTASALVAENSHLVHPVSTYPSSVSGGVEDHASFGVNAGLKALTLIDNISKIVSIELLCAASGADTFGEDELAQRTMRVYEFVRKISPALHGDRSLSSEITALANEMLDGSLAKLF